MDRTAWIVVITCIALIILWEKHLADSYPPVARTAHVAAAEAKAAPSVVSPDSTSPGPTALPAPTTLKAAPAPVTKPQTPAREVQLKNQHMVVTLTSHGGAIAEVELLEHKVDDQQQVHFNHDQAEPILNLFGWEAGVTLADYEVTSSEDGMSVTFSRTLSNGLKLDRTYRLSGAFGVNLEQTLTNPSGAPLTLPEYSLNVGTAGPLNKFDTANFIKSGWSTGATYVTTDVMAFDPGGFFGMNWREARSQISSEGTGLNWVTVKNQFFATILTPENGLKATRAVSQRTDWPRFVPEGPSPHGIKTVAFFEAPTVPAMGTLKSTFSLYAGPKKYDQIKVLGERQEEVMEFGWFGWVVKPLLGGMNILHRGIPSWGMQWSLSYGWVVILITLIIKAVFWPLQSMANRSTKQMQALQPKIKELQEKYKEEPQKVQTEQMKLFSDYGVNPMGGCLPMLVQIPIFMGFYTMLQSAIELRHVSWFWVHDLSLPDTVCMIPLIGWALNPLPILMTLTQWYLMKMTPTPQDNPSMKMMQWMPFVMLFMLYNFAAALALYWTVNNLVTVVQTYRNLRKPLPKLERKKKPRTNPFGQKKL